MAKARETTAPDPPVESEEEESGEEEEEEASEEENQGSESESETEGAANAKKSSSAPALASKKPESETSNPMTLAPDSSSSSEDEESGSETDTDSPPKKPDPSIKPIASKPMSEPEKTTAIKKPRSKPNASGPSSPTRPAASAGAKRPAPVPSTPTGDADSKRPKRKLVENSEKKGTPNDGKKLFMRVWSEDDEIAILKGMIDYSAKKKADPVTDLNAFHEFIKNKINIDVTRTQLQDKIRRLRKKYINNAGKEQNGKERTFSNPHEQKAYDLSKKIWGNKKNVGEEMPEVPKANGTAVRKSRSKGSFGTTPKIEGAEEEAKEQKSLASDKKKRVSFVPDGRSIEGWVFNDGLEFMEEDDRVDMEAKWKQLRTEEAGLLVKRLELSYAHAKKVYESLKSSGD